MPARRLVQNDDEELVVVDLPAGSDTIVGSSGAIDTPVHESDICCRDDRNYDIHLHDGIDICCRDDRNCRDSHLHHGIDICCWDLHCDDRNCCDNHLLFSLFYYLCYCRHEWNRGVFSEQR